MDMVSVKAMRHIAQNEMVFREYNERVQKGFDELVQLAQQEGKYHLSYEDDAPLHFYCECSDENCDKRILLKPSVYARIHEHRQRFVVIKGHDIPEIERVVRIDSEYSVIEKRSALPKKSFGLHATDADNR